LHINKFKEKNLNKKIIKYITEELIEYINAAKLITNKNFNELEHKILKMFPHTTENERNNHSLVPKSEN
jgi:hypothetical protein